MLGLISADKQENDLHTSKDDSKGLQCTSVTFVIARFLSSLCSIVDNNETSSAVSPLLPRNKESSRRPAGLLAATLRARSSMTPSPSLLRRRNVQHVPEVYPGRQPESFMFDTASIYSSPSMFSLNSAVDDEEETQSIEFSSNDVKVFCPIKLDDFSTYTV